MGMAIVDDRVDTFWGSGTLHNGSTYNARLLPRAERTTAEKRMQEYDRVWTNKDLLLNFLLQVPQVLKRQENQELRQIVVLRVKLKLLRLQMRRSR